MIERYMNREIKAVMAEFPAIEKILEEYGVGCGTCSAGSCQMNDIVTIHVLSDAQETELMARLALVFEGREAEAMAMKGEAKPLRILYSTPIQTLVDEHGLIKRFIALIPSITTALDLATEEGRSTMAMGIDMIRSYADRFHHAKEEDILFGYTDEGSEMIRIMYEDHKAARAHVQAMIRGVDARDTEAVAKHLIAYGALLSQHIKKEDEILYPFIDRGLSGAQIRELILRFKEADETLAVDTKKYTTWIEGLEKSIAPEITRR